jgi:hypothetical protein
MDLYGDGPLKIRDRTGQTQDAMMSARRKLHPERRLFQERTAAPVQGTIPRQLFCFHVCIGMYAFQPAEPFPLDLPGFLHPEADGRR